MIFKRVCLGFALAIASALVYAADCSQYLGKGYCTDYIFAQTGQRQPGDAQDWKGDHDLSLLQKGGENIFYRNSTQIPDVPGTLWTQPSYLSCFFSHVINKPEPFRKRHSSLFTLHIPAVIIINRTIPNINTNSRVYYKERKEYLEIFLCGSPVNRYIDYHVLSFFFRKNGACYRLLPTLRYNA